MTAPETKNKNQRGISSIEVGFGILNEFAVDGKPIKLRDLAERTGIAAGQLHPYLVSFRNVGMIEKNDDGLYQLGPHALHLGLMRLRMQNAHRMAISRVAALSEQLSLMISVAVWGPHGPTITYIQEYARSLHVNIRVGGVYSLPMTATGLVFCAFLPEAKTNRLVEAEFADNESRRRDFFKIDKAAFNDSVEQARKLGFATTQDMPIPGITAVSAPVFDHLGKVQLCVAAVGPSDLMEVAPGTRVVSQLLDFTETLSHDLGYRPELVAR